jgi:hypothetical protein
MAELSMPRRRHPAAQRVGHELHAVADAQDRCSDREKRRVALRRAVFRHALGPARQDDPDGPPSGQLFCGRIERQDLAVDGQLTETARNQLRELRAEVENQDGLMGQVGDP